MKKRVFSLVLALLLCGGLAVPVLAANEQQEVPITWLESSTRANFWGEDGGLTPISYDEKSNVLVFKDSLQRCEVHDLKTDKVYQVGEFHDGLAWVHSLNEDRWGYVNQEGRMVIPAKYGGASDFSNGLAVVLLPESNYLTDKFVIDANGELVPILTTARISSVSEGLICASTKDKKGFIDRTGETVIPFQYDWANPFSEGLAAVSMNYQKENEKWGYINKTGQMVIPMEYDSAFDFADGLAEVGQKKAEGDCKFGCINAKGEVVVPLEYDGIGDFYDGMARVTKKDAKGNAEYGFINTKGEEIVPAHYCYVEDFCEGYAPVSEDGALYSYIDTSGHVVISDLYAAHSFCNGMAAAKKDDTFGLIDRQGNMIVPTSFPKIGCLGTYAAQNGDEAGIIGWVKDVEGRFGIFKLPNSMRGSWVGKKPRPDVLNFPKPLVVAVAVAVAAVIALKVMKKKAAPAPVAAPTADPAPVTTPDVPPAPDPVPPSSVAPAPAPPSTAEPPRFCSNCGKPLAPGVNFCSSCGYNVKDGEG